MLKHNKHLADEKGLSKERRIALDEVYKELEKFLSHPTMYAQAKECPQIVQGFEYVLQSLWEFPLDYKMHRYEFDLKDCPCPHLDNYDRIGTAYRVFNKDCKYHGVEKDE